MKSNKRSLRRDAFGDGHLDGRRRLLLLVVGSRRHGRGRRCVAEGGGGVGVGVDEHLAAVVAVAVPRGGGGGFGLGQGDRQTGQVAGGRVVPHEVVAHGGQELALERRRERAAGRRLVLVVGVGALSVRRQVQPAALSAVPHVVPPALRDLHAGNDDRRDRRDGGCGGRLVLVLEQLRVVGAAQHQQPRHSGRRGHQQRGQRHVHARGARVVERPDRFGRHQHAEVLRVLRVAPDRRRLLVAVRRRASALRRLHLLYAAGRDERVVLALLLVQFPHDEHRPRVLAVGPFVVRALAARRPAARRQTCDISNVFQTTLGNVTNCSIFEPNRMQHHCIGPRTLTFVPNFGLRRLYPTSS